MPMLGHLRHPLQGKDLLIPSAVFYFLSLVDRGNAGRRAAVPSRAYKIQYLCTMRAKFNSAAGSSVSGFE